MRKIAVITALLLATTGARAEDQVFSIGRGNASCATWLSSPAEAAAGQDYILGLWTGLNLAAPAGMHSVGSKTDGNGIIAEVKALCAKAPSYQLMLVTMSVYRRIREREFPESQ